jgi:amino acid transporter
MSSAHHSEPSHVAPEAGPAAPASATYGLRSSVLSPTEILAQSVSTIAPVATPVANIPLACALAGNGTVLAFIVATFAVFLVALCIATFARYSASPGSLYSYTAKILPPWVSAISAWSLLLAYIETASSLVGGFAHFGNVLISAATGHQVPAVLLAALVTVIASAVAWRDIQISARLMLWIQALSVSFVMLIILLFLFRSHIRVDHQQLALHGVTGSGFRLGLVLALFSFVGFESATTLGAEARNPLKTIPRAVIQSALLAGSIFVVCAYTEVLGLNIAGFGFSTEHAPMRVLAALAGIPFLGYLIDVGALTTFFACVLGCIIAAARVLLLMSHNGLAHRSLRATHQHNDTPHRAVLVSGIAVALPPLLLAARGSAALDIYGWLGSLATYGFIVAYALVCLALPGYLRLHNAYRPSAHALSWLACIVMLLGLAGNLYPVPEGPYGLLPYIYLGYVLAGMLWFFMRRKDANFAPTEV